MDSTQRFSNRVADYVKFRPGYPPELLSFLGQAIGLRPAQTIADVGSGTGISAELLLNHGLTVYAVEPNPDMRAAAESQLGNNPNFHSVNGTAHATTLDANSIDVVTAFQAFHWFDPAAARREFHRILKRDGWVILVWNDRRTSSTPFLEAYESMLLKYGTDYQAIRHDRLTPETFANFYGPAGYQTQVFSNEQRFDFPGVKGRLLSSSYAPPPGHPSHAPMLAELQQIVARHADPDRTVRFIYDTRVYFGRLA